MKVGLPSNRLESSMSLITPPSSGLSSPSFDPLSEIEESIRRHILIGWLVVASFFGGAGLWLALAPLNSGAYASGQIIAESRRKPIQHLEGGLIEEVLVTDGSSVKVGDVLVRLRPTQARSSVEIMQQRLFQSETLRTRLMAERDGAKTVTWPPHLLDRARSDAELAAQMRAQEQVLTARRKSFDDQINILEQRNVQSRESIKGLEGQIKARRVQGALLDEEIATVKHLMESGNAIKPRLLGLQRNRAEIDSTIASLVSSIAQTKERIGETELQITATRSDRTRDILTQLRDTEAEFTDLRERMTAAKDVLDRVDVVAPQDGSIVNLKFFAKGQVVRSGETIMELVPVNDAMIITARIRPEDIDVVHSGMTATVRLTAYSRKMSMPLIGTVSYVSADAAQDERSGLYYYTAHVKVPPEEVKKVDPKALIPGSPASVMVETGERTAFEYLFAPFVQAWDRAFRED